ncbi:MAG: CidA/LrgA family protein [Thiotrichales bacterium]
MLEALAILLLYQLIGESIVVVLELPLPGPVIGMVLLFISLVISGKVPHSLENVTRGLLENLSLLFVPAGVGVITHLGMLKAHWAPITFSLVTSTLLTLAVTGWTMQYLVRRQNQRDDDDE